MLCRAVNLQIPSAAVASGFGNGDTPPSRQEIAGSRAFFFHNFFRRTARNHISAVNPGARTDIDDVIRRKHGFFIVFDHDKRIAEVTQFF